MWAATPAPGKDPGGRAPGSTSALSALLVSIHVWKAAPRSSCCCAGRRQGVRPGPQTAKQEPRAHSPLTFPRRILAKAHVPRGTVLPSLANRAGPSPPFF